MDVSSIKLGKTNCRKSYDNLFYREKLINLNNSQKNKLDNSTILNHNLNYNGYSSAINNTNINQNLLYDNIIKLKKKLNKLKSELTFLKGENHKKEEEIKKVQKILGNYKKKMKDKKFFEILRGQNQMIKLKGKYQNLQSQIKEKSEENKLINNKLKSTNIEEFQNENKDQIENFKEKINEYNNRVKNNKEYLNELNGYEIDKEQFFKNYLNLQFIKREFETKENKVNIMEDNLEKLKKKYNIINEDKKKLITYTESLQKSNDKLLNKKKKMESFTMNKPIIIKKIKEFEKKTIDLEIENNKNQYEIKYMQYRENKIKEEIPKKKLYKIKIEKNPEYKKDNQIKLYKSLINESIKKQNEYIKLFNSYNDYLEQNKNNKKENQKKEEEDKDNNSAFINYSPKSTNKRNDIIIDKKVEKKEKELNTFKLLLSLMFYVKKTGREKIETILLNYRTKNYFLDNLKDKNKYLLELSQEILNLIKDKNENDIKIFNDLFLYLFDEKYKNDKELFLDNIINDFVEKNDLIFKKNEETELYEKLKKEYLHKSNSIIQKLKTINQIISYNNLENIFIQEKLYIKDNNEKIKLFKYFIYIIRKYSSNLDKIDSIYNFSIEDIINFFSGKLKINIDRL